MSGLFVFAKPLCSHPMCRRARVRRTGGPNPPIHLFLLPPSLLLAAFAAQLDSGLSRLSILGALMSRSNRPTESRHKRGYGAEWDKVRKLVLEHDGHLRQCRHCMAEGRTTIAAEVDHIVSRAIAQSLGWSKARTEHPIGAQRRNVRIAPMSREHRQKPRPQHVRDLRTVRARKPQATTLDPAPIKPREIQKLGKIGHLPERRGRLALIPAHLHTSANCLHTKRYQRLLHRSNVTFLGSTDLVSPPPRASAFPLIRLHDTMIATCFF